VAVSAYSYAPKLIFKEALGSSKPERISSSKTTPIDFKFILYEFFIQEVVFQEASSGILLIRYTRNNTKYETANMNPIDNPTTTCSGV